MKDKILVVGSSGQIGTELVAQLRQLYGVENVIASDLKPSSQEQEQLGIYESFDIMDKTALYDIVKKHQITHVYLLAALLSATAEQHPAFAWKLNMEGLFNVLELAKEKHITQVYWPSSIAVFGPTTPRINTPQHTIMDPSTVYGISKLAGERWCEYYFNKFGVDVRSIRYPGLIGWKSAPGGGTTDYAVHIFYHAIQKNTYECFLSADTKLPMMYMPDAINATIGIMQAPKANVKIRSSYNLAGFSFTPAELANEIKKHLPGFTITYNPDFRQQIAESWPASIDDAASKEDWGWSPQFDLASMTDIMLKNLKKQLA